MTIVVEIEYDADTGTYGATSDDIPNIFAVGDSREDVIMRFRRSVALLFEHLRECGDPLPEIPDRVTIEVDAA